MSQLRLRRRLAGNLGKSKMHNEATIRQIATQTPAGSSFRIMLDEIDRLRALIGCTGNCDTCVGECVADSAPYPVTCARCGKAGTSTTFEIEEGDEWECPTCWEREEARIKATPVDGEVNG